jgi:hypothetical protein
MLPDLITTQTLTDSVYLMTEVQHVLVTLYVTIDGSCIAWVRCIE